MPSGASSAQRESERLAALTLFLDRQIGSRIVATALREAGARVEVHADHFDAAALDNEWIPEIGRRGWVLVTANADIRSHPFELEVYAEAGLRGFVVTGKDMNGKDLADLLVRALSGMSRRIANHAGPLLFAISPAAKFSKLVPARG